MSGVLSAIRRCAPTYFLEWISNIWKDPVEYVQVLGLATSVVGSALYLYRWYNINFCLLNEVTFVDYSRSTHSLTDVEMLDCIGREQIVNSVINITRFMKGQFLCVWGHDTAANDVLVRRALMEAQCRAIQLDFRGAVWADSMSAWMSRLEKTSSPIHSMIRKLSLFVTGSGEEEDLDEEGPVSERTLLRFKTLMSEKAKFIENAAMQHKDRPLVLYVRGVDSLYRGRLMGENANRRNTLVELYLEHLLRLSDVPTVHVIISCSDVFWLRCWLQCDPVWRRGLALHVEAFASGNSTVMRLWNCIRTLPSHCPRIPGLPSHDLPFECFQRMLNYWGRGSADLLRIYAAMLAGAAASTDDCCMSGSLCTNSVDALAELDIRNTTLCWSDRSRLSYGEDNGCSLWRRRAQVIDMLLSSSGYTGECGLSHAATMMATACMPRLSADLLSRKDPRLLDCAIEMVDLRLLCVHTSSTNWTYPTESQISKCGQSKELEFLPLYFTPQRPIELLALQYVLRPYCKNDTVEGT